METNKKVWIACRATEGCPGQEAELEIIKRNDPLEISGMKLAEGSGKVIRYKCTTCKRVFRVAQ